MLECVKPDDWQRWTDMPFRVHLGGGVVQDWVLDTVRTWGEGGSAERKAPYTLTFEGPLQPYALQGMRRLEHPTLGALEIFFVPLGPVGGRMRYEAVFA